jgi:hypothetical protein
MTKLKDVHTEHCCIDHGCKYGDENCTVVTGKLPQSFACEDCESELLVSPKQLYQFHSNHPLSCYHEDATYFITTLEKLDYLLTDEEFLESIDFLIGGGITGYKILDEFAGASGVKGISIQYLEDGEYNETIFSLFPVKSFI